MIEEQIKELPLDEKIKLSKKSCFYSYDEVEEVKLVSGKKHKFIILSKECVSKFAPNDGQFKQLADLLPTIEMLKNKLSVFGNLELNAIQEVKSASFNCKYCNYENDLDAVFCQNCGNLMQREIPSNPTLAEIPALLAEQKIGCKRYSAKSAAHRLARASRRLKITLTADASPIGVLTDVVFVLSNVGCALALNTEVFYLQSGHREHEQSIRS